MTNNPNVWGTDDVPLEPNEIEPDNADHSSDKPEIDESISEQLINAQNAIAASR